MAVKARRQQGAEEQIGDVKFSMLNETQFQSLHGPTWVRAQGQSIAGSDLAVEFGITALDDPRGRTIVGTGQGSGLTDRANRSTFGAESHTLAESEMPSHAHGTAINTPSNAGGAVWSSQGLSNPNTMWGASNGSAPYVQNSEPKGGGSAHNNVQPSIAYYCYVKINR